jgi:hypothetical protein
MNWYWMGVLKVGAVIFLATIWLIIAILPLILGSIAENRPGGTRKDGLVVALGGYGLYLVIFILIAPLFMTH